MAGGMRVGRGGRTLAERSGVTAAPPAEQAAADGSATVPVDPGTARVRAVTTRHCWVAAPAAEAPGRWAGLLVEWRRGGPDGRAGEGWEGRVVYAVPDGEASVLIEAWVPAQHLRPAG